MKIPMIVTKDTTLRELNEAPELAVARDSLISGGGYFEGDITTSDLITVKGSVINGKIIIAK